MRTRTSDSNVSFLPSPCTQPHSHTQDIPHLSPLGFSSSNAIKQSVLGACNVIQPSLTITTPLAHTGSF